MVDKCGIYKITNIESNKVYIGSSHNLKSRKYNHFNALKLNSHINKHLQSAYNKIKEKYGEENINKYFKWKVEKYIDKCEDKIKLKEELLKWENYYLKEFILKDKDEIDNTKCYNFYTTAGSPLGTRLSEETKEKMRDSYYNRTQEKRDRCLENLKLGHTEESTKKRANSNRGKKRSKEFVNHCRESRLGRVISKKGRDNMSKGSTVKKRIINITTGEIFESIIEASKCYNTSRSNISSACRGLVKKAKKCEWKYLKDVIEGEY